MTLQPRTFDRLPRRLAGVFLVLLLIVVAACSAAAGTSPSPAATPAPSGPSDGLPSGSAVGAPVPAPGSAAVGPTASTAPAVTGSGTASAAAGTPNAAIAYPYQVYPGTPGVAPDHTIVVTGVGQASVKADLSDRTAAQRSALTAALADAKAQADIVAQAAGVTITGVLSVSVSSGQSYAVPMAVGAPGSVPGATGGGTTTGPSVPVEVVPTAPQLEISVTVAYRIN